MPVVLYDRQRQLLDFIAQFIQKNNYAPSLKVIAEAMGLRSLATVHEHIDSLVKKGVLKKSGKGEIKSLEIVDKSLVQPNEGVKLPILGFLSVGKPIEPFSDPNFYVNVAPTLLKGNKRSYALQVRGDGFNQEGIINKDYLILEEGQEIKDGDVVVALLEDNSATIKRFYKEITRIRLEPIVASLPPVYTTRIKIQGKVVALIRNF